MKFLHGAVTHNSTAGESRRLFLRCMARHGAIIPHSQVDSQRAAVRVQCLRFPVARPPFDHRRHLLVALQVLSHAQQAALSSSHHRVLRQVQGGQRTVHQLSIPTVPPDRGAQPAGAMLYPLARAALRPLSGLSDHLDMHSAVTIRMRLHHGSHVYHVGQQRLAFYQHHEARSVGARTHLQHAYASLLLLQPAHARAPA